jgi:SAM-dependent methyltransferase
VKIHLGCGTNVFEGWVNLDREAREGAQGITLCDLREPLPFEDGVADCLYAEHFIEHVDEVQGMALFQECYRVLRPGGWVRFSCPDLEVLIKVYLNWERSLEDESLPASFRDGMRFFGNRCRLFNGMTLGERDGPNLPYLGDVGSQCVSQGHRFLYNEEDLTAKLRGVGFTPVRRCPWRESEVPALRNLETRDNWGELIIEGMRP